MKKWQADVGRLLCAYVFWATALIGGPPTPATAEPRHHLIKLIAVEDYTCSSREYPELRLGKRLVFDIEPPLEADEQILFNPVIGVNHKIGGTFLCAFVPTGKNGHEVVAGWRLEDWQGNNWPAPKTIFFEKEPIHGVSVIVSGAGNKRCQIDWVRLYGYSVWGEGSGK